VGAPKAKDFPSFSLTSRKHLSISLSQSDILYHFAKPLQQQVQGKIDSS
jgi:hypothetical protein